MAGVLATSWESLLVFPRAKNTAPTSILGTTSTNTVAGLDDFRVLRAQSLPFHGFLIQGTNYGRCFRLDLRDFEIVSKKRKRKILVAGPTNLHQPSVWSC